MYNWFVDKRKIKGQIINEIMGELECLLDKLTREKSANYWIDNAHNVFAFVNDNGDGDRWIEIHYELYDWNEEHIGDLAVGVTDEVDEYELLEEIKAIVELYFGD